MKAKKTVQTNSVSMFLEGHTIIEQEILTQYKES